MTDSDFKNLLPKDKIEVSYKLHSSNDINSKGYPIGSIAVNVSDNIRKYITPEHEAHEALLKIVAISKDAAQPIPTKAADINAKYYPVQKESFFIYPIQDPQYFENEHVKNAKRILVIGASEPVSYDGFLDDLTNIHKETKEKYEEYIKTETAKLNTYIDRNNEERKMETAKNLKIEQDKQVQEDIKKNATDMIEKLNEEQHSLRKIINNKKDETNNTLTADQIKENQTELDKKIKDINLKKKERHLAMNEIRKLDTQKIIADRRLRELNDENSEFQRDIDKLPDKLKDIDSAKEILTNYHNELMKTLSLQKSNQKGGYQPKRGTSRRQSKTRGGSRKNKKRSGKNKPRKTTI